MKRYRFRLDTVLRVRRIEEERAVAQLAQAQRKEQEAKRLQMSRLERYQTMKPPVGVRTTEVFIADRTHIELVASSVVAAATAHEIAVVNVEEHRTSWSQAAGRVTSLENLEERDRLEYDFELNKAETAALDDLTSARRGRKQ